MLFHITAWANQLVRQEYEIDAKDAQDAESRFYNGEADPLGSYIEDAEEIDTIEVKALD